MGAGALAPRPIHIMFETVKRALEIGSLRVQTAL
jgi:hypothetical protein